MNRSWAMTMCLAVVACGAAPDSRRLDVEPGAAPSAAVAAERTALVAEPLVMAPVPTKVVATPAPIACALTATDWSGDLRLSPGGPAYGSVSAGPITLSFAQQTAERAAFAEAFGAGASLRGFVDEASVFLTEPTALSGFVFPFGRTPLGWRGQGIAGKLGVTLDISGDFATPAQVETVLDCSKLSLTATDIDTRSRLMPRDMPETTVRGGQLFSAPGTPSVAEILPSAAFTASRLTTRGLHTRVLIHTARYDALGWVPEASLNDRMHVARRPQVRSVFEAQSRLATNTCSADLELLAEALGERAIVGTLRAGTGFVTTKAVVESGFVAVDLLAPWFKRASGAQLLIRDAALAACGR